MLVVASALFSSCEQYVFDPPVIDPEEEVFFAATLFRFSLRNVYRAMEAQSNPDLRAAEAYASLVTDANPATKYVNTATPETSLFTQNYCRALATMADRLVLNSR